MKNKVNKEQIKEFIESNQNLKIIVFIDGGPRSQELINNMDDLSDRAEYMFIDYYGNENIHKHYNVDKKSLPTVRMYKHRYPINQMTAVSIKSLNEWVNFRPPIDTKCGEVCENKKN